MKKYKEKRPWGGFEQFILNEKSTVKILTINPKQQFSLQFHKKRTEFWRFLEGNAKVTIGRKKFRAKKGDEFLIKPKTLHRIEALSKQVKVLEISLGTFNEKDIVRIEDVYGRIKGK